MNKTVSTIIIFLVVLALGVTVWVFTTNNNQSTSQPTGTTSTQETTGPDDSEISTSSEQAFRTYTNERFGYSVRYPADVLAESEGSQNNDGMVFSTTETPHAQLRVSARNNATDMNMVDALEEIREDFQTIESEEGRQIYAVVRGVGVDGNQQIERIRLENENVYTLELSYEEGTLSTQEISTIVDSFSVE